MKTFRYSKELALIVIGMLIMAGLYLASQWTPGTSPTGPSATVPPAGPIEVRGRVTCLPHRDTTGPQTLECAFGLRDEKGRYYALRDTDPGYANVSRLASDADVIVRGTFTPREDEKYQSIGMIDVTEVLAADSPQRMSLAGTYLCLPHKDQTGPQTDECAAGLKTDDGTYYALDLGLSSQTIPLLAPGDRVKANGVFTPIERLSTDHWRNYPIIGIFSVTDSLERL